VAVAGDRAGFAQAFGVKAGAAAADALLDASGAIEENWIKAHPCCLQTHAPIDAALAAGAPPAGRAHIAVTVHPVSRQAAALDAVRDGLEAKFSIPYLTAYALLHGAPGVDAFAAVDDAAAALAERITVRTDAALAPDEALLAFDGRPVAHVTAPRGCPANPLDGDTLQAKVRALCGEALDGALDDPLRPARDLLTAIEAR
ncbi:MAG TPA: hypothetical protein VGV67_02625, partial [Solirubrobacteraceae bacterium]|nr:hypothetical protein [Solirubrobacteraceae bacterium]